MISERDEQTVTEGAGSPVWEEATEAGGKEGVEVCRWIGQTRGALRALVRCHLGAEGERATAPAPVIWSKVTPPRSVTQWLLNDAFRPVQLRSRMNHLTSAFYFWRGSRFCAAAFPLRREHWSAPRPHMRAAVGLIRPSAELFFLIRRGKKTRKSFHTVVQYAVH